MKGEEGGRSIMGGGGGTYPMGEGGMSHISQLTFFRLQSLM